MIPERKEEMGQFSISNIKSVCDPETAKTSWIQHVMVYVQYTTKTDHKVGSYVAASCVYDCSDPPQNMINAKIENAKMTILDAVERKIGVRSGIRGHRGCFIFQSFQLLEKENL